MHFERYAMLYAGYSNAQVKLVTTHIMKRMLIIILALLALLAMGGEARSLCRPRCLKKPRQATI